MSFKIEFSFYRHSLLIFTFYTDIIEIAYFKYICSFINDILNNIYH